VITEGAFNGHEHSNWHKKTVEVVVALPKTTKDTYVGEMFSFTHLKEN